MPLLLTIPHVLSFQMGYGARALDALQQFYSGDLLNLDEVMEEDLGDAYADGSKVDKVRIFCSLVDHFLLASILTFYVRFCQTVDNAAIRSNCCKGSIENATIAATSFRTETGATGLSWSVVWSNQRPTSFLEASRLCTIVHSTDKQRFDGGAHLRDAEDSG